MVNALIKHSTAHMPNIIITAVFAFFVCVFFFAACHMSIRVYVLMGEKWKKNKTFIYIKSVFIESKIIKMIEVQLAETSFSFPFDIMRIIKYMCRNMCENNSARELKKKHTQTHTTYTYKRQSIITLCWRSVSHQQYQRQYPIGLWFSC